MLNAVQCYEPNAIVQKRLLDEAARLEGSWQELDADRLRAILHAAVTRVQVHSDRVEVTLDQMGVALWLNAKDEPRPAHSGGDERERHLMVLTIPARLKRAGIEMRLVSMMGRGLRMSILVWSVFCSGHTPYAPACSRSQAYR